MKPLSREASDALSALRSPEPTAADEARVRENLERTLGIAIPIAGVAVGAGAAQTATGAGLSGAGAGGACATALGLGAKVMGFVVAVGLGTTLTVAAARSLRAPPVPAKEEVVAQVTAAVMVVQEPPPPPPEVEVTVEAAPAIAEAPELPRPSKAAVVVARASPTKLREEAVAEEAVAEEEVVAEQVEEPSPPPAPPNTKESYDLQIETQFPSCDAATEMRSALNARRLLVASRAEEAVGLLEAYQRRCPSGRWSNEAWAVRVGGLCMLGRGTEARGFLDWFSSESPDRRAAVVSDLNTWCPPEILKQD